MTIRKALFLILAIFSLCFISTGICYANDRETDSTNVGSVSDQTGVAALSEADGVSTESDFTYVVNNLDCSVTGYKGSLTEVVIPEAIDGYTVKTISSGAFQNNKNLVSVKLPSTVTTIGSNAFRDCTSLISVDLPSGLTTVDSYAFSGCSSLSSVTLPDSITYLYSSVFSGCASLTSINIPLSLVNCSLNYAGYGPFGGSSITSFAIPDGMKKIPNHLFEGHSLLTEIAIPDSVEIIGEAAFLGCASLAKVSLPASLSSVEYRAFYGCTALKSIQFPENTETINSEAFYNCKSLDTVIFSDSIKTIGEKAFYQCSAITTIDLPLNLTVIKDSAFDGCKSLALVKLYGNLTDIGYNVFDGCVALKTIELPESLKYIGKNAFNGCTSLSSIVLPNSITTLQSSIFSGCTGLTSINIPLSLVNCGINLSGYGPFGNSSITSFAIPDGMKKIPNHLFEGHTLLTEIAIPDSVETIGEAAFLGCASLAKVSLPASLTSVEYRAFYGCTALKSIEFPENTETINSEAFYNCKSLDAVVFSDSIKTICEQAFYQCSAITTIDLPLNLTVIKDSAFNGCKSLALVKLYGNLTDIGYNVFDGCAALKTIELPESLKYIGKNAFNGCTSLSSIVLPNSITTLQSSIFSGCTGLTSINIPLSLVNCGINLSGYGPFGNSSITSFDIPDGMKKIPNHLFEGHTLLTEIAIPDSVEIIGEAAFYGCASLTKVSLPEGLTTISYHSFGACDALESIVIPKSVTSFDTRSFYGSDNVTILCYSNSAAHLALEKTEHKFILIDDHEHSYNVVEERPASCQSGSYKESVCTVCKYVLIERGEPLSHNFESETVDPTCHSGGYTLHTCTSCGYSYSDNHTSPVPESHIYSAWTVIREATVFENGLEERACTLCGATESRVIDKIAIDVETNKNYGVAHFTVVHAQTLLPIENAQIFTETSEGSYTFVTDVNGKANITLPVGRATLSFIAKDCLVRNLEIEIKPGINEFAPVGLSELKGYDVEIKSRIMTLEEIEAVGIDVSDPANQHVVEYELKIKFKSEIDYASILAYFNSEGICVGTIRAPKVDAGTPDGPAAPGKPIYTLHYHVITGGISHSYCEIVEVSEGASVKLDYVPERNSDDYVFDGWYTDFALTNKASSVQIRNLETTVYGRWIYVGEGEEPKFGFGDFGISLPLGDETLTVYPVSENFYLIVRGEVKWLKEMFDVEMLIVNNSMTDTLENLYATLKLPDGLSLPKLFGEEQSTTKYVGAIGHGESESLHWYVRGDTAGKYSLSATLTGRVMPFNEEINDSFVSAENLHVYAGNAMHLNFSFPSVTYEDDDYPMVITLTNVSDITLYNVHNLFVIKEGMTVYYSDGTSKVKWKITNYRRNEFKEFRPGDQLIIELSMKIFFNSEVIEAEAQKYINDINELEKLWNMYKAANELNDRIDTFFGTVTDCMSGVEKFVDTFDESDSKIKLTKELLDNLKKLRAAITGNEDEVNGAMDNSVTSIVLSVINALSENPEKWLKESKDSDIKSLIDGISALTGALNENETQASDFNVFESLRKAISAVPVRFAIESVVMLPKASNTTVIPWSYTATDTDVRYFGVSNVSSYILSLAKAIAGTYFEGVSSIDVNKSQIFNDAMDKAEKEIKATENELESFKVSDTTGKKSFKAWVEKSGEGYSRLSSAPNGYVLFSDNESAVYKDGVLSFFGAGWIYLIPTDADDCTLYIESDDGTLITYHIDVVEAHACVSGGKKTVISPCEAHDGFAIECCNICGEIMDIITLYNENVCEEHSFGNWEITLAATCTEGGIRSRVCDICGYKESEIIPSTAHAETKATVIEPTCTEEGYTVYSCQCGEHSRTDDYTPKNAHVYGDDGKCDICGEGKPVTECDCKCHRRGIAGFFFRLFEFFRRIFGNRHVCDCENSLFAALTKENLVCLISKPRI
ncbi:MAG: hypothetical protein E7673_06480 [Ruminococcaceae bacterium]|nr:hypothetical protein [Oscillospiraceae bacterium]